MDFNEKTLSIEYVYKGRILNLRKDEIALPNGKKSEREIIEHSGGCAVLCVKDGKILLVKQFRYAYKKTIIEIPAGKINVGELPEQTALRELEEECGLKAKFARLLCEIYPTPGYTNEIIRLFSVTEFEAGETRFDEDEYVEAFWLDVKTAKDMVLKGEIKDAKTIIALSYL